MDPTMPPWLQALANQMYPGQQDMSPDQLGRSITPPGPWHGGGTPSGPILPIRPDYSQPNVFPGVNSPHSIQDVQYQGTPPALQPGPQGVFPQVNMPPAVQQGYRSPLNQQPANPSQSASPTPVPRGVIPGQQRVNRTANNPNFIPIQYQSGVSGASSPTLAPDPHSRAPIYTAANLGNIFGQAPRGALANPNATATPRVPNNSSTPSASRLSKAPWNMGPLQAGMVYPSAMGPFMREYATSGLPGQT